MSSLLIRDVTVITMNDQREILPNSQIWIEGDKIKQVGPAVAPSEGEADQVIEGQDLVAIPGLINAHTHLAMTLMRGYADDMELMPWLKKKIWPIEMKLKDEDVYWGGMLGIMEMLKAGVTTFNDMYHHFEATAQAVVESGTRACICGVLLGFLPGAQRQIKKDAEFVEKWQGAGDGRLVTMFGPHAPYTCPDHTLKMMIEAAQGLGAGIHIHLAETEENVQESLKTRKATPVVAMDKLGMFEAPWVVAAHCVHVTDEEIEILRERRVGVSHNPGSNMKLASGIARIPEMLEQGVVVGLGTDGAASNNNLDILEEARLAALLHKLNSKDPTTIPAYQALYLATRGSAQALNLADQVGLIAPGMKADIVVLDYHQPHLWPPHDLVSHLIYSARAADVRATIVNGELLYHNGRFLKLDEEKIMAEAAACAQRLMSK